MKLRTTRDALVEKLQATARVASTRSAVQALSGVQVLASDDGVELRATDMEIGLRTPLQATIERPGEAVVPARLFLDVARSLPATDVTLELRAAEQDVEVVAGPATFHLRTLRLEDFPPFPEPAQDTVVRVPTDAFAGTVQTVARAVSRDETRPILTGILVSAADRELRMVATDSYRLSVKETRLDEALEAAFDANVPARALAEVVRLAQAQDAPEVTIGLGQNQVVFDVAGVILSSRLIDGQFPNYRQLLPDHYEHELRLARAELLEVVRRIGLLAQKNAPLRLRFSEGELTISAQTPDVGEAREALPVPYAGEPLEIGFNPEFLRDAIESVESDELVLRLISPLRPGLVEGGEGEGFLYLIMPIRLNV